MILSVYYYHYYYYSHLILNLPKRISEQFDHFSHSASSDLSFVMFYAVDFSVSNRLRQTTYERLLLLSGGGLSRAMQQLLSFDPLTPVLSHPHLLAFDRRLHHILATLSSCRDRLGGWHHILY